MARTSEDGLGLMEVIIAMMVFALIATGIGYTMLAALRLTQDSTSREQAANLAAQEIDLVRSIDNLFNLVDKTTTTSIGGIEYTIHRTARWVSDPNVNQRCGLGGGILRYKRVNVTVSWPGMTSTAPTVRSDTLIDPGVRINDPDLGTVLIAVTDSGGNPVAGATVNVTPATPANGAQPLSTQPAVTDSLGCTYALMVDPGNYDVTVKKTGYVDINQNSQPSKLVSVQASSAAAAEMTLDRGGMFPLQYSGTCPATVAVPTDLDLSFTNTYGTSIKTGPPCSVVLFPFAAGYSVLAGVYNDPAQPATFCNAVDPGQWLAGTTDGINYNNGVRLPPVATVPGGTAPVADVGMGVVNVWLPSRSGGNTWYVRAVSQATGPTGSGNPGCDILMTYDFGEFQEKHFYDFALPYGTWKLYVMEDSGGTGIQHLTIGGMTLHTPGQLTSGDDVVTFDPRPVL